VASNLPTLYKIFNDSQVKNLVVVVDIDGVDLLSSSPIYERLRYGDPDLFYGDPGLVYGGLRVVPGVRSYLSLDKSSLTISQKIEPEQGRGSVTQLSLSFIDKDQYMTQVVSPGIIIPEILGREVNVYLGYRQISYPEDFIRIYRGYVSGVDTSPGTVTLAISDPNFRRRQNIFFSATTTLNGSLTNVATSVNVAATGDFYAQILGPNAAYDAGVTTYIKVEEEFMLYGPTGIVSPTQFLVTRGARGTTAVAHADGADVSAWIELTGNAVDLALKIMLSGWDGPWISGILPQSFVNTLDITLGFVPGAIVLPLEQDAVKDYGLVPGDQVIITGGVNNGISGSIIRFINSSGVSNSIVVIDQPLTPEYPAIGTIGFRSQYDVFPVEAGARLSSKDVDVARHEFYRDTFLQDDFDQFKFLISAQTDAKTFIESNIFLPLGAYSVTREGRLSMGITRPPIADQKLVVLDGSNVINPHLIRPNRATNNRKFWNDFVFNYEYNDAGAATQVFRFFNADSFDRIGVVSTLPITAIGAKTEFDATTFFEKRGQLLSSRFANGAVMIPLETNWGTGNLIEAGDIIAIRDNGDLQIPNFVTGERDLGFQLYEVIDRQLDIKTAKSKITVVAGVGSQASDRYATISGSSVIDTGSTTTRVYITDAMGTLSVTDEADKWDDLIGNRILVHDEDYVTEYETVLRGIDPLERKYLIVDALPSPPSAGWIVDVAPYSTSTNAAVDQEAKILYAHFSPDVVVVTGISTTQFTVSAPDAAKVQVGFPVIVHTTDTFAVESPETVVTDVTGVTITVKDSLGFTPNSTMTASLLGFADGGACYRWI
jgi:hypothetical protein